MKHRAFYITATLTKLQRLRPRQIWGKKEKKNPLWRTKVKHVSSTILQVKTWTANRIYAFLIEMYCKSLALKKFVSESTVNRQTCRIVMPRFHEPVWVQNNTIIIIIIIIVPQDFLPGTSPLEPAVISSAQASSFRLQYFPHYVRCSKCSCLL
jgi:hypothetical protein